MNNKFSSVFNKTVLIGAAIVAFLSIVYLFLYLNGEFYIKSAENIPRAGLTVVASGPIPTTDLNLLIITPTPTVDPGQTVDGISAQKFVKITGTEGVGLRIRKLPGINSDIEFIANESEVFIVVEGPQYADELVWWLLATPYDENRKGWAAADYLAPIEN